MSIYRTLNVDNFKSLTPEPFPTYDNHRCSRCGRALYKNFYLVNRVPYCSECINKLYNTHSKVISVVDDIIDFTYINNESNLST